MPPKCRFSREDIISSAIKITREKGFEAVSARSVGAELGASQNVIFSTFRNMEELKEAAVERANSIYQEHLKNADRENYPPYKAAGMAYIHFAKEERELFRLLFMRDRRGEKFTQSRNEVEPIIKLLTEKLSVSEEETRDFHLQMWIFVHGIAVMVAESYITPSEEEISRLLTKQFLGMKAIL